MYWTINFDLEFPSENFEYIRNGLYLHHCILSAEPPIEAGIFEDGGEISKVTKNKLVCQARVFHKEDTEHLQTYVERLTKNKVEFHHKPFKERIKPIVNTTKFTPIVIFVILLVHEALTILSHDKIDPWISAVIFSIIGAGSVFIIDSVLLYNENFS